LRNKEKRLDVGRNVNKNSKMEKHKNDVKTGPKQEAKNLNYRKYIGQLTLKLK
jgi:hypothetical protein